MSQHIDSMPTMSEVGALNSKKVFGMNKITASSLEELKTKLTSLADTMANETSTELVLVTTPAFDVFPNGTHSITFHKLASTYYWGYGYVSNHIVTLSRAGSTWSFSNDYNTLNSKFTIVTFNATSSDSIVDISSWVSSDKFVISAVSGAGNMVSIPFLDNNGKWSLFLRGTASWQTLADSQRNFRVVYMS